LSRIAKKNVYKIRGSIAQAWNSPKKTSIQAVCKKVANFYKDDVLHYPEDYQICVLIVDKFKFYGSFDRDVEQYCESYYEFCVNDHFLVVITLKALDNDKDMQKAGIISK
jgi:hypothetical protein